MTAVGCGRGVMRAPGALGQRRQPGLALEQYRQGLELFDAVLRGGDQVGPDGGEVGQPLQSPPRSTGRALVDLGGSDLPLRAVVGEGHGQVEQEAQDHLAVPVEAVGQGGAALVNDRGARRVVLAHSAGTTSYVYDASGNQIVRRDPGATTFYMGDEQLTLNTTTGTVTGVRYYSINGATIAVRNSNGQYSYLIPDRQGTDQLAINASTLAVTRRQFTPFGAARGTAPTWVGGDKGYIGGNNDAITSLETLGARVYDTVSGRFLSADPLLETTDPTQMGGYDYAGNNPATGSDPTGKMIPGGNGGGGSGSTNVPRAVPPVVKNATLKRILDEEYEVGKNPSFGDGRAISALYNELETGKMTAGSYHYQDISDLFGGAAKLLAADRKARLNGGSGILDDSDLSAARLEAQQMWDVLNAEDVTGKVLNSYSETAIKQIKGTLNNAIRNPAIEDVTGTGFTPGTELKAPRAVVDPPVNGAARALGISLDIFSALPLVQGGIDISRQGLTSYELSFYQSTGMSDMYKQTVMQHVSSNPNDPNDFQMLCTVGMCA
jgi:RHS repeat-associated protein